MDMRHRRGLRTVCRIGLCILCVAAGAGGMKVYEHFTKPDESQIVSLVREAEEIISENYVGDADAERLEDYTLRGMTQGLSDRWSHYVSSSDMQEYRENNTNSFVGIGVLVTKEEGEGVLIRTVYDGSGAGDAGLSRGDVILNAEGTDLLPLTLDEAKSHIAGQEGTSVSLLILHSDGKEEAVEVERRSVFADPVTAERIGELGYITLADFDEGAWESFREKAEGLLSDDLRGLVIDVRNNPGGYVTELVPILDYLLPEGEIFCLTDRDGRSDKSYSDKRCIDVPITVLVNAETYSAAEYLAGILQYYGVAEVVGEQTSGKGYSQMDYPLSDGSVLVLSTWKYTLPDGSSLEGVGVVPDREIVMEEERNARLFYGELDREEDIQLQTALNIMKH